MKKGILLALGTTLFLTACINDAQNASENSIDNRPERKSKG
ncbi:MAG: hypothetical protein AAGU76_18300 [Sedimentibacter sp.]